MQTRLISSAIDLIKKVGYSRFRTADVADNAEVSRGAQLHHFPTKDSLVLAALYRLYDDSFKECMNRIDAAGDKATVNDVLNDAKEYYYAQEFFACVDVIMAAGREAAIADEVANTAQKYRVPVEEGWAQALAKSGVSVDDARDAVWFIQAVIRGLRFRKLMVNDDKQTKRIEQLAGQLIKSHLESLRKA